VDSKDRELYEMIRWTTYMERHGSGPERGLCHLCDVRALAITAGFVFHGVEDDRGGTPPISPQRPPAGRNRISHRRPQEGPK